MTADRYTVTIRRGDAASARDVAYEVPAQPRQTVLDLVTHIQRHRDRSLAYRFACRVGVCGSCAMTVNGRPRWTCRTQAGAAAVNGRIALAPLANLPVIRDLATDMAAFFDKWQKARGRFVPSEDAAADFAVVEPQSPERRAVDAGIECIGCGVCYSACDVVRWNPDYLGPAALNRAWTLMNDVRDAGHRDRLSAVAGDAGCHACHSQQSCAEHCPKHLSPTSAIAGLKRLTLRAALKGEL